MEVQRDTEIQATFWPTCLPIDVRLLRFMWLGALTRERPIIFRLDRVVSTFASRPWAWVSHISKGRRMCFKRMRRGCRCLTPLLLLPQMTGASILTRRVDWTRKKVCRCNMARGSRGFGEWLGQWASSVTSSLWCPTPGKHHTLLASSEKQNSHFLSTLRCHWICPDMSIIILFRVCGPSSGSVFR